MKILAIESSCDETAAAVVEDGRQILSSVIHSQAEEHRQYGGVVPEIASRRHTENIIWVVEQALAQADVTLAGIDAIAVTAAPGLIGALLVGVNYAKGLALALGKPLIPVHHIRGHVAANFLAHPDLTPAFLCLIASGGHSHIVEVRDYTDYHVIGRTRDDAAGECFDKAARAMGFPYPGGIHVDRAAQKGDPEKYKLPRPRVEGAPYDFSFSGLKTSVVNLLHNAAQKEETIDTDALSACLQRALVDALCDRLELAATKFGFTRIAAAGGVVANSGLRARLEMVCKKNGWQLFLPPLSLCGDNAAMIGAQAFYETPCTATQARCLNAVASKSIVEGF